MSKLVYILEIYAGTGTAHKVLSYYSNGYIRGFPCSGEGGLGTEEIVVGDRHTRKFHTGKERP